MGDDLDEISNSHPNRSLQQLSSEIEKAERKFASEVFFSLQEADLKGHKKRSKKDQALSEERKRLREYDIRLLQKLKDQDCLDNRFME